MTPREQFERTTCACDECRACCKRQPGPLIPGDFERIRDHLQTTTRNALALFWASPGALVRVAATKQTRMIGTITPRMVDGRCIFLDADERCTIHAVAPFGCAYFDMHQPESIAMPRSLAMLRAIDSSVEYQLLRECLPAATSWRPVGR